MPHYSDAYFGGETIVLENAMVRWEFHKRRSGWGWGELFVPPSPGERPTRFFGVLEHFGLLDVEGQIHPFRLEAADYSAGEDGRSLTFELSMQKPDTSTGNWGDVHPATGTLTLSLEEAAPRLHYRLAVQFQFPLRLRALQGPWLKIGADSFGMDKHDAILPGMEWVIDDEWSSGTDFIEHPFALRVAPHPNKVAFPCMAISRGGTVVSLEWNAKDRFITPKTHIESPQPVFASPNFVDRRSHHLMGLMYPSVGSGLNENTTAADPPVFIKYLPKNYPLDMVLEADIVTASGSSLDAIVSWVREEGLPTPPAPRMPLRSALRMIARAFNEHLWEEGKGWWSEKRGYAPIPWLADHAEECGIDAGLAGELKAKAAWCREHAAVPSPDPAVRTGSRYRFPDDEALETVARALIELQQSDGSFAFDPDGRHNTFFTDSAGLWRPLGRPGEVVLDLCVVPARELLVAAKRLDSDQYAAAAKRALDYALRFERPEGGDWWETPLRSPNLLTAGNAAIAYYLAGRHFGEGEYHRKAIRHLRGLLPFTHLWEPRGMETLYNTKPCFNDTGWFLSDWTSKHVQWEALLTFALSYQLDIDWAGIDTELDWNRYQEGITVAAIRWIVDSSDPDWLEKSEFHPDQLSQGALDGMYADTYNPLTGTYGGGPVWPDSLATNIAMLLSRKGEK